MSLWEVTGTCTRENHRGRGPDTWGKIRGDNVGKDHLPAGAGSNLRRLAEAGTTEVCERVLVRRMSSSERRRRGNALPGGLEVTQPEVTPPAGKGALGHGGGSGEHSLGPRTLLECPFAEPSNSRSNLAVRGACKPVLNPPHVQGRAEGSSHARQPDSGNPTVRDDNGGPGKRGPCGTVNPARITERARSGNPPLQVRAPRFYPNRPPASGRERTVSRVRRPALRSAV